MRCGWEGRDVSMLLGRCEWLREVGEIARTLHDYSALGWRGGGSGVGRGG